MTGLHYRPATSEDMAGIIRLHISISRQAYAHILPQPYLDTVMPAEKQALWEQRFSPSASAHLILVAVDGAELAGFCCFVLDEETEFGTYLHNLYVSPAFQRRGVASAMLREAIILLEPKRMDQPVHLLAFARNSAAIAVYDRLGGIVIERKEVERAGNPAVELVRYQWPTASVLLEELNRGERDRIATETAHSALDA